MKLSNLFDNEMFSDVILYFKDIDKKVYAHKVILVQNEFMEKLFNMNKQLGISNDVIEVDEDFLYVLYKLYHIEHDITFYSYLGYNKYCEISTEKNIMDKVYDKFMKLSTEEQIDIILYNTVYDMASELRKRDTHDIILYKLTEEQEELLSDIFSDTEFYRDRIEVKNNIDKYLNPHHPHYVVESNVYSEKLRRNLHLHKSFYKIKVYAKTVILDIKFEVEYMNHIEDIIRITPSSKNIGKQYKISMPNIIYIKMWNDEVRKIDDKTVLLTPIFLSDSESVAFRVRISERWDYNHNIVSLEEI